MKKLILSLLILFPFYVSADFDQKCSVLITLRFQSNDDAYKDALAKIKQCEKYDILSVTSFLDASVSKIYITDLIQNMCMFNHEIVSLIDNKTSNLSCVYRGKSRVERSFN
mgnify:FL=1|jgi:hypothetical protein|tara:strand:- start:1509 stop:1841 length:333 start_codon:yes stop_codon:yes gene_type:complete